MIEKHKVSIEILYHFNCRQCNKWWSIGDFDAAIDSISCPYCQNESGLEFIKEKSEILSDFYKKMMKGQKQLPADFAQAFSDYIEDII